MQKVKKKNQNSFYRNSILVIIILALLPHLATAASITGTIYDYNLNKVSGAIVQINTEPAQTQVTSNGTYKLEVPLGNYELKVSKNTGIALEEKAQADITISSEGSYTYDLILFRDIEEMEEPPIEDLLAEEESSLISIIGIISIIAVLIGLAVFIGTKKSKQVTENEADLEQQLLAFLAEKKRSTQKEIRKSFPYAEATISLALSSLEHQGKISKIKKGRGNIIILQRKKNEHRHNNP
jgi:uncharacterized membrane protein